MQLVITNTLTCLVFDPYLRNPFTTGPRVIITSREKNHYNHKKQLCLQLLAWKTELVSSLPRDAVTCLPRRLTELASFVLTGMYQSILHVSGAQPHPFLPSPEGAYWGMFPLIISPASWHFNTRDLLNVSLWRPRTIVNGRLFMLPIFTPWGNTAPTTGPQYRGIYLAVCAQSRQGPLVLGRAFNGGFRWDSEHQNANGRSHGSIWPQGYTPPERSASLGRSHLTLPGPPSLWGRQHLSGAKPS